MQLSGGTRGNPATGEVEQGIYREGAGAGVRGDKKIAMNGKASESQSDGTRRSSCETEESGGKRKSGEGAGMEETEATPCTFLSRMWPFMIYAALYAAAHVGRNALFFFFLRTTIDCGEQTPDDFDRSSGDWSGSKYCNDRCKVAREATLIKGIAEGIEQFGQLLCLPAAGVLADTLGRNVPYLVSFGGGSASLFVLAGAAFAGKGNSIVPLVMLSVLLLGLTDSFSTILNVSVTDTFTTATGRGYVFGSMIVYRILCAGVVLVSISVAVIARNPYDYAPVFTALASLMAAGALLLPLSLRETNTSPSPLEWEKLSPLYALNVFYGDPFMQYVGVMVFCVISATAVTTIAGGYVIGAYGYTQTQAVVIGFAVGSLAFLAACASPILIRAFGNRRTLRISLTSVLIGLFILCFSPIHRAFFFLGITCLALTIVGIPAYNALISERIAKENMGRVMGAVATVANVATAVFTPIYAAIFNEVGAGGECEGDTNLKLAWIPWGIGVLFAIGANVTLCVWFKAYPQEGGGSSEDKVDEKSSAGGAAAAAIHAIGSLQRIIASKPPVSSVVEIGNTSATTPRSAVVHADNNTEADSSATSRIEKKTDC
eukprot:jgi/Bigna1/146924/aug1.124_g21632